MQARAVIPVAAIRGAFQQAAGKWTGCDWSTRFGTLGLDLNSITSRQALLMARATGAREAFEWWRAAAWLAEVEKDARQAQHLAAAAVDLALRGQIDEAAEQAREALELEARHHDVLTWRPLGDMLGVNDE